MFKLVAVFLLALCCAASADRQKKFFFTPPPSQPKTTAPPHDYGLGDNPRCVCFKFIHYQVCICEIENGNDLHNLQEVHNFDDILKLRPGFENIFGDDYYRKHGKKRAQKQLPHP